MRIPILPRPLCAHCYYPASTLHVPSLWDSERALFFEADYCFPVCDPCADSLQVRDARERDAIWRRTGDTDAIGPDGDAGYMVGL